MKWPLKALLFATVGMAVGAAAAGAIPRPLKAEAHTCPNEECDDATLSCRYRIGYECNIVALEACASRSCVS